MQVGCSILSLTHSSVVSIFLSSFIFLSLHTFCSHRSLNVSIIFFFKIEELKGAIMLHFDVLKFHFKNNYAIVEFASISDAVQAKEKYCDTFLHGQPILISNKLPKAKKNSGSAAMWTSSLWDSEVST